MVEMKLKRWVLEKELKELRERIERVEEERDMALLALMFAKSSMDQAFNALKKG
jgi:hypothetical protein